MKYILLLIVLSALSCAGFEAKKSQVAGELDTDSDGVVSVEELQVGVEASFLSGNWEYLLWIISVAVTGEGARRLGKRQEALAAKTEETV